MFHFRKELEPVRYGFNFYRLNDKSSFGFILKYWKKRAVLVRYSKDAKCWFCYNLLANE